MSNKELSKTIIKPKKVLTQKQKEIIKLNKKFIKAKPFEKRIIIAKDVVAQLKLGKYISTSGAYCRFNSSIIGDLQKNLLKDKIKCNVCAIGSMFTSSIRINDKFKFNHYTSEMDDYPMRHELEKYFSEKQLAKIEEAFECWDTGCYRVRKDLTPKTLETDNLALIKIMENIISNKGTFRPER